MNITSAVFYKSIAEPSGLPEETFPEIVFVGRSNVGKSSLLNSLTGVKGLAKTSSTPGKTRLINFFTINDRIHFVDLPGYGYAAVGHEEKAHWGKLLSAYIERRRSVALVLLLVDARHPTMPSDREMMDFLDYHQRTYGIIMTKDDKLSQKERHLARRAVESFSAKAEFIVNYSSFSGKGKNELLAHFEHYIGIK
jgi:GTP-binding protein